MSVGLHAYRCCLSMCPSHWHLVCGKACCVAPCGLCFLNLLAAPDYDGMSCAPGPCVGSAAACTFQGVLYGIFPVVLIGAFCSFQYVRFCRRPLRILQEAFEMEDNSIVLKDVFKFRNAYQVSTVVHVKLYTTAGVHQLHKCQLHLWCASVHQLWPGAAGSVQVVMLRRQFWVAARRLRQSCTAHQR